MPLRHLNLLAFAETGVVQNVSPGSFVKFHEYHWGWGEVENEPRESGY